MKSFYNQSNKLKNVETDYLASFVREKSNILMILREDCQSSSTFWEVRNRSGTNEVVSGPYVDIALNYHYLLGLGKDGSIQSLKRSGNQRIYPGTTFTSIASGHDHVLSLRDDGELVTWGYNRYRQTDAPDGTYLAIASGRDHSLALRDDGELVAWGDNRCGQTDVPGGTYTAIAAGSNHSLALRDDGELVAWGDNHHGQTDVPSGNYAAIAARYNCNLALRDDDELVPFGSHHTLLKVRLHNNKNPFIAHGSHQTFVVQPDGEFFIVDNRRPNPDLD